MAESDPITRLNEALKGHYHIERELGEGGMATVYLAHDLKHDRQVALKVLKPELASIVGGERFLAEITTTANLQHPHILPLHDSGDADGFLYYVMPYVEGESLRQRLDREHQLPVGEAVRIATSVAEALDYAHRQGVVHRDIKPANILLQDGMPVVSDFGIALAISSGGGHRLTETGLSLGTPHYMSPEQATGDANVRGTTDVYALGCVLYEMLAGEPPYTGSTPQAILGRIIAADAPSIRQERKAPANVDAAIRKALEKIPADRFESAGEMARALRDPLFRWRDLPGTIGVGTARWRRAAIAAAGAAAVLAVLLLGQLRSASSSGQRTGSPLQHDVAPRGPYHCGGAKEPPEPVSRWYPYRFPDGRAGGGMSCGYGGGRSLSRRRSRFRRAVRPGRRAWVASSYRPTENGSRFMQPRRLPSNGCVCPAAFPRPWDRRGWTTHWTCTDWRGRPMGRS